MQPKSQRKYRSISCAEPSKHRNRIIGWPIWANDCEYDWSDLCEQEDILKIIDDIQEAQFGACFDLKCSFYQVDLPPHANAAFVFEVDGAKYCFNRLPMGYSASAEIMQLISQTLAEIGARNTNVKFHVHVDNIMYYGSKSDVQMAMNQLITFAKGCNVTFSETPQAPASKVLFHGVYIDFDNKTIAMGDKAINKFSAFDAFLDKRMSETKSHIINFEINSGEFPLLKMIGTGTFWSRTMYAGTRFMAGCMASRFAVMQLIRAVARAQFHQHTTFAMNRGSANQLRAWLRSIPVMITPPLYDNTVTVTTDASTTGGGFVIQHGSSTHSVRCDKMAFPWHTEITPSQMGTYELRTIAIALANSNISNTAITLRTDSTIAIGALTKGYSSSLWRATLLSKVERKGPGKRKKYFWKKYF